MKTTIKLSGELRAVVYPSVLGGVVLELRARVWRNGALVDKAEHCRFTPDQWGALMAAGEAALASAGARLDVEIVAA